MEPLVDAKAMQLHLDEIARTVDVGAHVMLIFDWAGWRTTPIPGRWIETTEGAKFWLRVMQILVARHANSGCAS